MKRLLLCLTLLLLMSCTAASANSWGLKGDLLDVVMDDHTWDDYSAMDQQGNVAAMSSLYHNALMVTDSARGPLQVYTRALWQPSDHRTSAALSSSRNGFTLTYRKSAKDGYPEEGYRFERVGDAYVLQQAVCGDFTLTLERSDGLYIAREDDRSARLFRYGGITLADFSIRLLPRSVEEVVRLNHMRAALDSGSDTLGWWGDAQNPGTPYVTSRKITLPVYGAPDDSAWRANKSKASVSLRGGVWLMQAWQRSDGERWLLLRYDVSQRTQRFGFVSAADVPDCPDLATVRVDDPPIRMTVRVAPLTTTTLTDDPLVSQYNQLALPAGTEMLCTGMFNDEYAYVRTTTAGKEIWGFVPLKDLVPVRGAEAPEVMASLAGCWFFEAGGSMSSEYLRLRADGTFDDPSTPAECGAWTVTVYDPADGLYWNNPPYEITFLYEDGRVNVKGLTLHDGGFSLTNWEGGGGYAPIDEADVPLRITESGAVG